MDTYIYNFINFHPQFPLSTSIQFPLSTLFYVNFGDYVYGLMTGLCAWISLTALSRTYFIYTLMWWISMSDVEVMGCIILRLEV